MSVTDTQNRRVGKKHKSRGLYMVYAGNAGGMKIKPRTSHVHPTYTPRTSHVHPMYMYMVYVGSKLNRVHRVHSHVHHVHLRDLCFLPMLLYLLKLVFGSFGGWPIFGPFLQGGSLNFQIQCICFYY